MLETILLSSGGKLNRQELALVPTPTGTTTHKPVPHIEVVNALLETLAFRHITVVRDEYAVDKTGAKIFGVMELDQGMEGARFALGIRNSHDKTFRLAITVGYRVFVCENLAFSGDYSLYWQNTVNTSRFKTPSPSASITCSETSNQWWRR